MTWWSEHSAVPRFVFAKSAIRCRFVDRFAGFRAPSRVSGQRFSPHGAPLPSAGSRRARFPAIKGHIETLRLPARASPLPYFVRSRGPRTPPSFVLAEALPTGLEEAVGPGTIYGPAFLVPASRPWTRAGSHRFPGDPSYAFALLQDPGRAEETSPLAVSSMLPPGSTNRRPQQKGNIEADTGLQHPLSTLQERRRRHPCKTRFRLAGCASTGRASNPLDRFERFQVTFPSPFPGLSLSQVGSSRNPTLAAAGNPSGKLAVRKLNFGQDCRPNFEVSGKSGLSGQELEASDFPNIMGDPPALPGWQ